MHINQKIDMAVCIDSGIDCEFLIPNTEDKWSMDILREIRDSTSIYGTRRHNGMYELCRPRMNHIHASPTGWETCPLPEGFVIRGYSDGCSFDIPNYFTNWNEATPMLQVTGIAEGYEL